jgi:nickel superoxide dismutase
MRTVLMSFALFLGCILLFNQQVYGHCQIPCGIYDDYARVKSMLEDVQTIEKSTKLINELAGKNDAQSKNQLVRWVMNKEKHAQNIISTISDYFLTQRVKPAQKDYITRLIKHHAVIIAAMKTKQHADQKEVQKLEKAVKALLSYYPEPVAEKEHQHAAH